MTSLYQMTHHRVHKREIFGLRVCGTVKHITIQALSKALELMWYKHPPPSVESLEQPIQQHRHARKRLLVNVTCQGSKAPPSIAAATGLCGTEPLPRRKRVKRFQVLRPPGVTRDNPCARSDSCAAQVLLSQVKSPGGRGVKPGGCPEQDGMMDIPSVCIFYGQMSTEVGCAISSGHKLKLNTLIL
ncbi:unnamed protein product [Tetraodon nigroviridis]|uniref:(spotted green pufferfish) hypothetical protein n=1 Tax=Tetraodon nigroviridis TaxID=99883 RepID=Q4SRK4_TETNG|nr:unnamed protein product [Tetraodon nigroviridis]